MMTIIATTSQGTQTKLSDDALERFRGQLRGPVLTAADPGHEAVREVFNTMYAGGRPALTVLCAGTADVIDAVNFAREQDLLVAVRGGGHSVAGLSVVDGGMLIDLSPMRGVQVDPQRRLAHVQGGALWGDLDRETQAFGLATPGGVNSETGVAGLTLGGGYGWIRRKHGLSCDNLVEAQVVCADGQARRASAGNNPDLYWAIRGGGGNFGIVTSFTFRLHPLGPIVPFAAVFYPVETAADILRGWRDYAVQAPDEVTSVALTVTFPADPRIPAEIHNRPCTIVAAVYAGDVDEGMKTLQPLRELSTSLADMSQPMPYTAVQAGFDHFFPRNQLRAYWKSEYLSELSDAAIEVIAAKALDRPSPLTLVAALHMGGAINRVGPQDTAFAERSAPFLVTTDAYWTDPARDSDMIAWVRSAWDDIRGFGTGGIYLNFTALADEATNAGIESAFGQNLRRLAEIKATYDPDNFFRLNNNIVPAHP
ncbi:MAG: FAD-binding oxidoreductase [Egibacteraceae bacterium]